MTFREYYRDPFRADLVAVVSALPSCHPPSEDGGVVIHPRTLSVENPHIRSWGPDRTDHFASALYWTVLVDQVCYTHFKSHYGAFQRLTRYPKFRGNCLGCSHLHPRNILNAIGSEPPNAWSGRARLSNDAVDVMREEIFDFFERHLKAIPPADFWRRCLAELDIGETGPPMTTRRIT